MLVVPFVCAEFHDKSGNVIHRIRANELRNITEVPDAIIQDPLYALLVEDGSLKAPESKLELKTLENDPDDDIAKVGKPAKSRKTTKADKPVHFETEVKSENTEKPVHSETEKPEKAETEPSSAAPAEVKTSDGIQAGKKA